MSSKGLSPTSQSPVPLHESLPIPGNAIFLYIFRFKNCLFMFKAFLFGLNAYQNSRLTRAPDYLKVQPLVKFQRLRQIPRVSFRQDYHSPRLPSLARGLQPRWVKHLVRPQSLSCQAIESSCATCCRGGRQRQLPSLLL
jgi:hypothetical protein